MMVKNQGDKLSRFAGDCFAGNFGEKESSGIRQLPFYRFNF